MAGDQGHEGKAIEKHTKIQSKDAWEISKKENKWRWASNKYCKVETPLGQQECRLN